MSPEADWTGEDVHVKKRAAVLASVFVLAIVLAVPVLVWALSPSPVSHTVRAALCNRGRPSPDTSLVVHVTPQDSVPSRSVRRLIYRHTDQCCPEPRTATSRADARSKYRTWQACLDQTAIAIVSTTIDPTAAVPKSRDVKTILGRQATCSDQKRVASYLRRSGLTAHVYASCRG